MQVWTSGCYGDFLQSLVQISPMRLDICLYHSIYLPLGTMAGGAVLYQWDIQMSHTLEFVIICRCITYFFLFRPSTGTGRDE